MLVLSVINPCPCSGRGAPHGPRRAARFPSTGPCRGDCFHSGHLQPAQHIPQAYLGARPAGLCPPTQEAAPESCWSSRGREEGLGGLDLRPPSWGWREAGIEWCGAEGLGGLLNLTRQIVLNEPWRVWGSLRPRTPCHFLGIPTSSVLEGSPLRFLGMGGGLALGWAP